MVGTVGGRSQMRIYLHFLNYYKLLYYIIIKHNIILYAIIIFNILRSSYNIIIMVLEIVL